MSPPIATLNDVRYGLGGNNVRAWAAQLGVAAPISLLAVIRAFMAAARPIVSVNLSPQPGATNEPIVGLVFSWLDPRQGSYGQATVFDVAFYKRYFASNNENWLSATMVPLVAGALPQVLYPGTSLDYQDSVEGGVSYRWTVRGRNKYGVSAAAEATFTTKSKPTSSTGSQPGGQTGQSGGGYSQLQFYNCSSLHYPVNFWTYDITTGIWEPRGSLDAQYDSNGTCPGAGASPMLIDLTDGHTYMWVVVAPDQQTCGGKNDPTLANCIAWQGGPVAGSKTGPVLLLPTFVGA